MDGRQIVGAGRIEASRTIIVQTALDHEGPWSRSFYGVFERAIEG